MRPWRSLSTVAAVAIVSTLASGPTHAVSAAEEADSQAILALGDLPIDVRPDFDGDVPEFGPTAGSEVALTSADAWHAAGIDGSGVRVGVIDFFDVAKYWDVAEHGPAPVPGINAICLDAGTDCTADFFDGVDEGAEDHGVAIVEIVKDMAPGAEIFIGRALTITDYFSVVDWFAANGVQVVNRSLGSRYDGPGDGRGGIDSVASYAVSRGITWVNSVGNAGTDRYYRHAVRLAGDRVAFGPSGSTTFLAFNGCVGLGGVRWANDWDKPPNERTDYDVYLWDSPLGSPAAGTIVASSTQRQRNGAPPIENFDANYCPSGPSAVRALYLEIRWRGGDIAGDVIEILDYGSGMSAFTQSAQSATTGVSDSNDPGVLAVGAIDPPDSGSIAFYSSRGPTNDGRIAPDISAAAGFYSHVFLGAFSGTSAAAPVVAGGAALLLDRGLAADPRSLGDLLRHLAIDRGDPGPDHVYGYGEFRLPPPPAEVDQSPSTFVALDAPQRVLDTRPESAIGPSNLIGRLSAGDVRDLPILGQAGVPGTGVTAVALNITAVGIDQPAFVQALPTLEAAVGGYSNINLDRAGQTQANFAIVPVGSGGSISLYTIAGGHMVVDVLGYFTSAPAPVAAGRFVGLGTPERLLDTRLSAQPLSAAVPRQVPMPNGIDPAQVGALVVTVTGTEADQPGWLQAFPADRPDVIAGTSTVNLVPGAVIANTAIVPVGSAGIAVAGFFGTGSGHAVVDVIGYITSETAPVSAAGRFVPVRPSRAFDSRLVSGDLTLAVPVEVDASGAFGVTIPADASGVVWNFAAVDTKQPGFGRVWAADAPQPATSSFNWSQGGETRASSVISAVDGGRVRVVMDNGSGQPSGPAGALIADVFGYFT
jgi:hypothetical protein